MMRFFPDNKGMTELLEIAADRFSPHQSAAVNEIIDRVVSQVVDVMLNIELVGYSAVSAIASTGERCTRFDTTPTEHHAEKVRKGYQGAAKAIGLISQLNPEFSTALIVNDWAKRKRVRGADLESNWPTLVGQLQLHTCYPSEKLRFSSLSAHAYRKRKGREKLAKLLNGLR